MAYSLSSSSSLDGDFQVFEFPTNFIVDTGALDQVYTGSGVHLNRDVTFNFSFLDNQQNLIASDSDFINNPLINLITYDVLDTGGNVIFANYKSGSTSTSLQITAQENENLFGTYTKDFGVRATVSNFVDATTFQAEFYVYGNVPKIQYYQANDSSSTTSKNIEIVYENPSTGYELVTKTTILYPDVQDEYASASDGIIEYVVSGQSGGKNLYIDPLNTDYYLYWETGTDPDQWRLIDAFNALTGFSIEDTDYPWQVANWEGDTGFFGGTVTKHYEYTESAGTYFTSPTNMSYVTGRGGIQVVTIDVEQLVSLGYISETGGISGGIKIERYADWANESGVGSIANSAIVHNGIIEYDTISPGIEATGSNDTSTILDLTEIVFQANELSINSGQLTGSIEIDLKLLNDLTYTNMISYDIYSSTSNNITLYSSERFLAQDNPFYLKTQPIQNLDNITNIVLEPEDGLQYDTPYYFAIVPNSAIGTGEALFVGPYQIKANANLTPESIFSVNRLRITTNTTPSTFVDKLLISGTINVSGEAFVLDTINRGEFTTVDYLTSFIDGSGTAFSSNIKIIDSYQAQVGSGIELIEYATGSNNYGTFSIETGDSTYSLLVSGIEPQATYKLFRTAL
jgi:hypothetical protein